MLRFRIRGAVAVVLLLLVVVIVGIPSSAAALAISAVWATVVSVIVLVVGVVVVDVATSAAGVSAALGRDDTLFGRIGCGCVAPSSWPVVRSVVRDITALVEISSSSPLVVTAASCGVGSLALCVSIVVVGGVVIVIVAVGCVRVVVKRGRAGNC